MASFLLAVQVHKHLIELYCELHPVVEAEFVAASKIMLIFWVAQGPVEPPFMYERTNKMLLCSSMNLADLMLR